MTADIYGRAGHECLCTELGLWAAGLWAANGSVGVVTTYPALPAGTRRVDVTLPGVGVIRDRPVEAAVAADTRLGPARPAAVGTWTYTPDVPPVPRSGADWPTPVPDPGQLGDYTGTVERITGPPHP